MVKVIMIKEKGFQKLTKSINKVDTRIALVKGKGNVRRYRTSACGEKKEEKKKRKRET